LPITIVTVVTVHVTPIASTKTDRRPPAEKKKKEKERYFIRHVMFKAETLAAVTMEPTTTRYRLRLRGWPAYRVGALNVARNTLIDRMTRMRPVAKPEAQSNAS